MNTIKEIIVSDNWIITSILQGFDNKIRIDAKTRFYKPDSQNTFSKWCKKDYANRLTREYYGKNTQEFNCYKY